jgi:hypothetical protein
MGDDAVELSVSPRGAHSYLAGAVMVLHTVVSLFILLGALLVWRGLVPVWLHLPLAAWGVLTHVANVTCPLTPLEKWLRREGGMPVYETGFVEQYLMPRALRGRVTRAGHITLGLVILAVNVLIYWLAFGRA